MALTVSLFCFCISRSFTFPPSLLLFMSLPSPAYSASSWAKSWALISFSVHPFLQLYSAESLPGVALLRATWGEVGGGGKKWRETRKAKSNLKTGWQRRGVWHGLAREWSIMWLQTILGLNWACFCQVNQKDGIVLYSSRMSYTDIKKINVKQSGHHQTKWPEKRQRVPWQVTAWSVKLLFECLTL